MYSFLFLLFVLHQHDHVLANIHHSREEHIDFCDLNKAK